LGASAFGAGFGGSVWALVPSGDADAFAGEWLAAYQRATPHVTRAESFVAQPGPPLVELPAQL
jgi:galactokinase